MQTSSHGDKQRTRLHSLICQFSADLLHNLRLNRQHHHLCIGNSRHIIGCRMNTQLVIQFFQYRRIGCRRSDMVCRITIRQHPFKNRTGHISCADKCDLFSCNGHAVLLKWEGLNQPVEFIDELSLLTLSLQ